VRAVCAVVVTAVTVVSLMDRGGAQGVGDVPAASARPTFPQWVAAFREEALSRGISTPTVEATLTDIEPLPIVVQRDRSQAEAVFSIERYIERRLTRTFVRAARSHASEQRSLLRKIAERYQVQPRFVVAIWGIESNFGRFSGVRAIVPALATLAWEGRREALFRGELFAALEIVDRGYIDLPALKGSWAGAMGQTQFMPSSYLKFAEDFDEDGHRDIWRSTPDVLASIANYLKAHGWDAKATWGREVRLPAGGWRAILEKVGERTSGCRAHREMTEPQPISRWQALGVRTTAGGALPRVDRAASLVTAGRRTFLVYGNYEALLDYNCAHAYALTVAMLADRIGN
jgi:membrane-bound lytic murein transglycosylase B